MVSVDNGIKIGELRTAAVIQKNCTVRIVIPVQEPPEIVAIIPTLYDGIVDRCVRTVNPCDDILIFLPERMEINDNGSHIYGWVSVQEFPGS